MPSFDRLISVIGALCEISIWWMIWQDYRKDRGKSEVRMPGKRLGLFLVLSLGPLVAAIGYPIYRSWHSSSLHWSDLPEMVTVDGQSFVNEKVVLDNRGFTNCKFRNVTFVYHGTGPVKLENIDIWPSSGFETDNDTVLGTFALLKGLGINPVDTPILHGPGKTPLPGIEAPHHVP